MKHLATFLGTFLFLVPLVLVGFVMGLVYARSNPAPQASTSSLILKCEPWSKITYYDPTLYVCEMSK